MTPPRPGTIVASILSVHAPGRGERRKPHVTAGNGDLAQPALLEREACREKKEAAAIALTRRPPLARFVPAGAG